MTNQEINEAVARKLGWNYHESLKPVCWQTPAGSYLREIPDYCHSIEAAWEIVEHYKPELDSDGFSLDKDFDSVKASQWDCRFGIVHGYADTAPLAICKAFLKLEAK